MKHRLRVFTIALTFMVTLMLGAHPSRADAPFYYLWENITGMSCSDTAFDFISHDQFSTPTSGDSAYIIQRLNYAGTSRIDMGSNFTPTWVLHPATGWIDGGGIFWGSLPSPHRYSVPPGTAYFISFQLIYRGVPGGPSSSSYLRFKCSGDDPRVPTFLGLDNQKEYTNL